MSTPPSQYPQVELEGTSYEIGFKHGQVLRKQILSQLAMYRDIFRIRNGFTWERAMKVGKLYAATIEKLVPDLYEEMRGIADGVGDENIKLIDIVTLNARSEIALGEWDDGCTSLVWRVPLPGSNARQFISQNWDWHTACGENLAIVRIKKVGKPTVWQVIEPGIIGKIGFNSASVGVGLNAIRARPVSTDKLPFHVLLRVALECTSVSDAIQTMDRLGGTGSSQHMLIADVNGAKSLEMSPNGTVELLPDAKGTLVHTNHFIKNKLVQEGQLLSGSPIRLARGNELVSQISEELNLKSGNSEGLTTEVLRSRFFADRYNWPQAICCDEDPGHTTSTTLFNIIMVLEKGKEPRGEVLFGKPGPENGNAVVYLPW